VSKVAAVVVLAIALAGCGGSGSKKAGPPALDKTTTTTAHTLAPGAPAYLARMHTLGNRLGAATDGLYPLDSGTPGSALSRATTAKLLRARAVLNAVAADLATIHPPLVVAPDHRRLRGAVLEVSTQIGLLVKSLRSGDTATFNSLAQLPALRLVIADTDAMKRKGYDIVAPFTG
jgi:hypothetical protein